MRKHSMITAVLGGALTAGCATAPPKMASSPAVTPVARPAAARAGPATRQDASTTLEAFADRAAGPGGGWLIGAREDLIRQNRVDLAKKANEAAQHSPATVSDVGNSTTADLNNDGFVTLDEVLAMKRAGLSERQIVQRIADTRQLVTLNPRQRQYLLDRGIDQPVIDALLARQTPVASASSPPTH